MFRRKSSRFGIATRSAHPPEAADRRRRSSELLSRWTAFRSHRVRRIRVSVLDSSCCMWSPAGAGRRLGGTGTQTFRGLPSGHSAGEVDHTTAPGRPWRWITGQLSRWSSGRKSRAACSSCLRGGDAKPATSPKRSLVAVRNSRTPRQAGIAAGSLVVPADPLAQSRADFEAGSHSTGR